MVEQRNLTNGFTLEEIGILYQFLVDYETSYKDFNSKEFNKEFPKFKKINDLLQLSKQGKVNMMVTIPAPDENQVLMTEGEQPSHFLKHLRHAFAHSQLIKKASFIELKDYPQNER